jgi:hypothetical protein
MTGFINKQIIRTSILSILNQTVWVIIACVLFYVFTLWIDPKGINWIGVILFDLFFLFIFLAGVWEIFYSIKYLINPKKHNIFKSFEKYGNHSKIQREVENEITTGQKLFKKTIFTKNWLLKNSFTSLDAVKFEDIIWIYEKKVTTLLNFVIPISTNYSIIIHAKANQEIEIPISKKNVSSFLDFIISKNPTTLIGYSYENITSFDKIK